ncbi:MAG: DUF3524 domain-containing protein [Bacteriovoracaceae bacterium]|nr:DUF3524 domain-containing protein [Bacteriovoracaceae bacterium]
MNIQFLESYDSGSHRYFYRKLEEQFKKINDSIHFRVITLEGRHWRWRLQGSHFHLANKLNAQYLEDHKTKPDLIIVTSLTDTAALRGLLCAELRQVPLIQYMHENQMSYPLAENEFIQKREEQIKEHILPAYHLNQVLAADVTIFNSLFHQRIFFENLENFCLSRPDYSPIDLLVNKSKKTKVIPIPIEFPETPPQTFDLRPKRVLWNHRWEYDKNPKSFIAFARSLIDKENDVTFSLLGENNHNPPKEFTQFQKDYPERLAVFGHQKNRQDYLFELEQCRLIAITSHHEFLGLSVLEAMTHGVIPLVPNRLVYPELIPEALHEELLYKDESELLHKGIKLLNTDLGPIKRELIEKHVSQFRQSETTKAWANILSLLE